MLARAVRFSSWLAMWFVQLAVAALLVYLWVDYLAGMWTLMETLTYD